jgi:hypothetical protein
MKLIPDEVALKPVAAQLFDATGERLTLTYAVKKGTRYRYYVSTSLITGAGRNRSARWATGSQTASRR